MAKADRPRASTIYDVARVAGVSHQTVARFLRGGGVRPNTRERVERAVAELDYRPNLSARVLATSRPFVVVAITDTITHAGPAGAVAGAAAAAREVGYVLDVVAIGGGTRDSVRDELAATVHRDIAGILAFALTDAMSQALREENFAVPSYVLAEDEDMVGGHPTSLNGRGMTALVDHLVALGHRRFFHIAGPRNSVAARNRAVAYEWALHERGLSSLGTAYGDWSSASGHAVVDDAIQAGTTALVVGNDQMALGAVLALTERGIDVPAEVSVVGFDDIPEAAYFRPPLTTIRTDFEAQGRMAFEMLLAQIEDRVPAGLPTVAAEFMRRLSTTTPPSPARAE